jgi:hypothetical protein
VVEDTFPVEGVDVDVAYVDVDVDVDVVDVDVATPVLAGRRWIGSGGVGGLAPILRGSLSKLARGMLINTPGISTSPRSLICGWMPTPVA